MKNRSLESWVLRSWDRDGATLPAFPTLASRLIDALEQPDVQTETVQEIISQDGSITAQVIRASNSAIYGGLCPVQDLQQAIMRIGFRETANVATLAASRSLFTLENRAELSCFPTLWPHLWQSSLVCAFGARLLARELKLADPARVFLCAVFRDIGSLLILKLVCAGMVRGQLRDTPSDEEIEAVFGNLHTQLGPRYLMQNQMPNYVIDVARRHHTVELPFAHDTIAVHLVRCADGFCHQVGAMPFTSGELGPGALESASALGVEEDQLEYFALQFEAIREQVCTLMDAPAVG